MFFVKFPQDKGKSDIIIDFEWSFHFVCWDRDVDPVAMGCTKSPQLPFRRLPLILVHQGKRDITVDFESCRCALRS